MSVKVPANAEEMSITAVVLRADGSVKERLGTVCYWHRNPIKRLIGNAKVFLRRFFKW